MRLERIPNFITEAERLELIDWIDTNIENKTNFARSNVGPNSNRYSTRPVIGKVPFPQVAFDIQKRILDAFDWADDSFIEKKLGGGQGMVAMRVDPGDGGNDPHIDDETGRYACIRCNIVLQKGNGGELHLGEDRRYTSFYDEAPCVKVDERELHCYAASEFPHGITGLKDGDSRYAWLFGINLKLDEWESGRIIKK